MARAARSLLVPTRLAVLAAVMAVPLAMAVALALPDRWFVGLGAPVAVLLLVALDALLVRRTGSLELEVDAPLSVGVGEEVGVEVSVAVAGERSPAAVELALAPDPLLVPKSDERLVLPLEGGRARARIAMATVRRGTALIGPVWARWTGPLGLVWRQEARPVALALAILPDLRPVREGGARLFERHALQGLIAQLRRGEGTEFEALVEYGPGMDRRAIDWKQSARHHKLYAAERRSEHNSQIVFAIDTGRQMSEPVAGLPRVDRAIAAALLTAWVALKLGDRVALHAFDARPRVAGGLVGGIGGFAQLQRLAASIDYSGEETNYAFALTTLAARLTRRSTIVLFTEFVDATSADMLVRSATRLVREHLLLIVVLRDEELDALVDRPPDSADDVVRAVTAAALLRQRLLVLTRLRQLGVHVVEADHDRVGEALVAGYVELKRRNRL